MKRLLLSCLTVLLATSVGAYDFEDKDAASGGTFYYNILSEDDGTCAVAAGDALYTGSITIPATATSGNKEYKVVAVAASAFQNCTAVTDITLRSQITEIGDSAFAGCIGISKVSVLNPTPPACGEGVFSDVRTRYCFLWVPIGTKEVYAATEPWSSFSFIEELDGDAFTIDGIYYNVLSAADRTVAVTWGDSRYWGTDTYVGTVTIPETVEYAGIVYTVTEIGEHAFCSCEELTEVTIPATVKRIGLGAFEYCLTLTSIDIPNSVTHIDYCAFAYCDSLARVTIGSGLESMGSQDGNAVFARNYVLTEFTVAEENENYCAVDNIFYTKDMTQLLLYPPGLTATTFTIPTTVSTLGESAFSDNYYLEKIVVPEGLTYMDAGAFYNCTNLKEVNIPKGVTDINTSLFYHCEALPAVTIPDYVTHIDVQAFRGCKSLKEVVIPNLVTIVNDLGFTFAECASLERVVLGQKVGYIGAYMLYDCPALKEIYSLNATPPETGAGPFDCMDTDNCLVYVPQGAKEAYTSISLDDIYNPRLWWGLFPAEHIVEIALTEVRTGHAEVVSATEMTLTGTIIAGEFDITERGFEYWGEDGEIHQIATTEDKEEITLTLTALTDGGTYTYRAYAIDTLSKFYGEERTCTAGVDGIESISPAATTTTATKVSGTYNLAGQRVRDSFKGIVIKDGKKIRVQ